MNDAAICKNNLQSSYGITRHAVADAAEPTSIGGDVSANRGNLSAGRIWRKEQSLLGDCSIQCSIDDSGLNLREAINWVDRNDLIHAL